AVQPPAPSSSASPPRPRAGRSPSHRCQQLSTRTSQPPGGKASQYLRRTARGKPSSELSARASPATLTAMSKTLVIAEKPSVGQDLARVLTGPFKKQEGWLEGPEHVITWAVGHLVQLAEPEAYDPKYKSWRMGDLPIVPDRFKLVVRDERSRKQMTVVTRQLARED